jgi:glycosyltransferase involved in cell wall biosynthesis
MSRILIISSGSPCRNPRPLKEAGTLGRAGHEVTLLTVSESPALDKEDRILVAGQPFRHESVGSNPDATVRFFRRVRHRLAVQATVAGFPTLHALGPAGQLRRRALEIPADLTIVHNEIPFWIGCDLLRRGRKVAADFEDWHSEDLLPTDRRGRPIDLLRGLENELLHRAIYTTTTSAALSSALAARTGAPPPQILTNSFPLQPNPRTGPPGSPPAFFWFSQTLGRGRGLEEFCEAWVLTKQPSRLVLLGQPSRGFDRELLARLPPPFAARVTLQSLVPPSELPALIARHDVGLALEQSSIVNRDLTTTNKILQYLNAGLAVAATPTAGQREVLARAPGAGRLIDLANPAATADALDELIGDPARLAAMQVSARTAAENTYCWEREAPRLVALVAAAIAQAHP